ncbi:phenylpropionate dioxygenase-like ring-hydroxylating dioxygenase large terminal subunit [Motilibacter rhizosphaerae]|uniref:Phenylpropionate dioxygenase-like ring-hydroxylating dioxygenase large terminal subunit n=1 Tax=Motilibacter rhizosphaerae TaxID=598652 RepID=A0A4Q7NFL4_9ACTN|nr:aromatic ring-hydroxylating dioxygenase subunit alpha [Motilibacter rhizosphaerae]RZS82680.1 phenylpropionate dioxygenase-like ring-hydroxylating dioxygenase large terminal subunit [Motilibacter rhizosphaerae]
MTLTDPEPDVAPAVARETTHHGPDHLVLSEHPVFRRFWYAVCFTDDVADGPVERTVLGQELVLWRPEPGSAVSAAWNRCAHRDAPLSMGWVKDCHLVCPYHGWEWDAEGRTQRIPQFPTAPHPTKSGLTMVRAQERYGMVWVCLADDAEGGPVADIPPVPQYAAPGWRVVPERQWDFACTAMHLVENNVDPGHVAFVHRATFGNPDNAELTEADVERTAYGFLTRNEVPVESRPGEVGATVRSTVAQVHLPFFMHLHITYPDGLQHVMLKAITPVDDEHCVILQTVLRTDSEAERPAADILAFDDVVEQEDATLLDRLPAGFPLAPRLNAHAKADRASLLLRRLYAELVTGRWTPGVGA